MNDKEVLEACITKAIKGGWGPWNAPIEVTPDNNFSIDGERWDLETIIFNHDFCRALWGYGNNDKCLYCGTEMWLVHPQPCEFASLPPLTIKPLWQYHLQQLAIEPDRIDYLRRNA